MDDVTAIKVRDLVKVFKVAHKRPGLAGSLRAIVRTEHVDVRAVDGVTFSVEEGETVAFIGPNGAGKSTTIKMLTGILYPTSGEATVTGMTPWKQRQRLSRSIGCVFGQRSQLWYHLPPRDTFELLAHVYELPVSQWKPRLTTLADRFELRAFMDTPVRKLSLGQRMRCEIAASLLHAPRVLFLDEPTVGLDVMAKRAIRDLVLEMNREEGVTVLLTSHDVGDIEQVCRRVMVINHGHLVLDTTVAALRRDFMKSKTVRVRLDSPVEGILNIPGVEVLKRKRGNLKLLVNTATTSMDDVLAHLMQLGTIEDITIADPSTEQIIAEIYASGR